MTSFDHTSELHPFSETLGPYIMAVEGSKAILLREYEIDFSNDLDLVFASFPEDRDDYKEYAKEPDLLDSVYWLLCLLNDLQETANTLDCNYDIRLCGPYHPTIGLLMDRLGDEEKHDFDALTLIHLLALFPAWLERVADGDLFEHARDRLEELEEDMPDGEVAISAAYVALSSIADMLARGVSSLIRPDCVKLGKLLSDSDEATWATTRLAGRLIAKEPSIGVLGYFVWPDDMSLDIFLTPEEVLEKLKQPLADWHERVVYFGEGMSEDYTDFIDWLRGLDPRWFEDVQDPNFGAEDLGPIYSMFENCRPDPTEEVAALLPFADLVMDASQMVGKGRLEPFLTSNMAKDPTASIRALKYYLQLISNYLPTTDENQFWSNTKNILETKGFVAAASAWLYCLLFDGDLTASVVSARNIKRGNGTIICAKIDELDEIGGVLNLLNAELVASNVLEHGQSLIEGITSAYVVADIPEDAMPNIDLFIFQTLEGEDHEFIEGYSLITEAPINDEEGAIFAQALSRPTN